VLAKRKSYLFISTGTQSVDCSVPQGSVLGPVKFIAYTEDLMNTITSCHLNYHLYADDTQVSLGRCVHWIFIGCRHPFHQQMSTAECRRYRTQRWCSSRRLQPNPSKTELTWFGTHCSLQKITASDHLLQINDDVVISDKPVVHDLDVLLDSELTMKRHISQVTRNCFHHIRRLKQIRQLLRPEVTVKVVTSLI